MIDQLFMKDLAYDLAPPLEPEQPATLLAAGPTPNPKGQVSVSGVTEQQVATDAQQGFGVARPIPQNKAQEALGYIGELLTKAGVQLDKVGVDIPALGRISLKDLTVGESGKVLEDMALGFYPIEGAGGFISGTTRIKPDEALELLNIAPTVGAAAKFGGKAAIAGATKAVQATKGLPVGMSIKDVGQGVDELGFYSAAKQAVDAIQQPKGTGDQFLKQIEKTPGVKPDEIKWTGLDEFLKSKKSVTKAEVQEYLDKNRVEVKEITLNEGARPYRYVTADEWQGAINDAERVGNFDEAERITAAWEDFELGGGRNKPKFAKYTLPGGENYREVLLTLPSKQTGKSQIAFKTTEDADNFLTDMSISGFEDMNYGRLNDTNVVEFDGAIPSNVTQMIRNNDGDIIAGKEMAGSTYGSPHFEQPNILAHLRVNDRIDADGKKVLFVEEVQSDWHQAGRKKGYATKPTSEKKAELTKQYDALQEEVFDLMLKRADAAASKDKFMEDALDAQISSIERQQVEVTKQLEGNVGVPDAPFKTTWSELAMKRAIQMASEGGYDRIAFTTGKTQAERFDLSKQIEFVRYRKTDDGKFKMTVRTPEQDVLMQDKVFTPESLEDTFGKELSEKIIKGEGNPNGYGDNILTGLDLSVGGEGMKGFYDDILPKFLNKYAKKWDAKAGMTEIPVFNARTGEKTEPVHYIDITPKMRESVMTKGQPMFAIGAGGAGAAATQQEDNK